MRGGRVADPAQNDPASIGVRKMLEHLKTDLGPNDAIHDELASAAYVENFALRVFASADTEDRR